MDVSPGQLIQSPQTIANAQVNSSIISTAGLSLVGIMLPAAFTGTSISFLVALTLAGTYQPLFNAAGQVKYTVVQGQYIAIDPKDFAGVMFLKLVSNASEGGARALTCLLKGI